jgi:hypothetical protein
VLEKLVLEIMVNIPFDDNVFVIALFVKTNIVSESLFLWQNGESCLLGESIPDPTPMAGQMRPGYRDADISD